MSNTKQQIEEMLPCVSCGINADVADGFGVCTCGNEAKREAIDRLVTEAYKKGYIDGGVSQLTKKDTK
jgi:hypothetical protein